MFTASPFFNTPAQRLSLARERFFERGERPTGLVSEAVIQSWMRCLHQRMEPQRPVVFEPVTASRVQGVLRRNRQLLQAGAAELQQLQQALAGTPVAALLIDAQGVVMHSTWLQPRADTPVMNIAARIGVNLSEAAVGTTAPGVAAHGAQTVTVEGGEHFAQVIHGMQCAAAPVRDARGGLVAVLDLSCEGRSFGFDAAQLVERYARGIENRLLCLQAPRQVVVRLQLDATLLHSPWAGLVGVDEDGQVDWLNAAAAALLGQPSHWSVPVGLAAEAVLGLSAAALHGACRAGQPLRLVLPSGLKVWAQCQRNDAADAADAADAGDAADAADGRDGEPLSGAAAPADAPAPPLTLQDADRHLVQRTLQACGGNVSQAARRLGVSRGLVYRHLKAAGGH